MGAARQKGTSAETAVVRYLQETHWPYAERRALHGGKDKGDVTGTPGVVWEVKAGSRLAIPEWMRETETEACNANTHIGVLVVKPKGVGVTRINEWWAILPLETATWLLNEAGYGGKQ